METNKQRECVDTLEQERGWQSGHPQEEARLAANKKLISLSRNEAGWVDTSSCSHDETVQQGSAQSSGYKHLRVENECDA